MTTKIKLSKEDVGSNFTGSDHYDLVIIGAGISGLSTALMWLKNTEGKRTLILEKNPYALPTSVGIMFSKQHSSFRISSR